jgi:hypothetical protein
MDEKTPFLKRGMGFFLTLNYRKRVTGIFDAGVHYFGIDLTEYWIEDEIAWALQKRLR